MEPRPEIRDLLAGELGGEAARRERMHLASCATCRNSLQGSDRMELLTAVDEWLEPSADLPRRFRARLEAHRKGSRGRSRWKRILTLAGWSLPRRLAAAGAIASLFVAGLYFGPFRAVVPETVPEMSEITIAENLPLLEDMGIIRNLELLEDFDVIQEIALEGKAPASTP